MTASAIIENIIPLIEGSKVAKESTRDTLLAYLNFAKGKLARDTNIWIGGQEITLVEGTNIYTLDKIPLQIVEVYDEALQVRPRNKFDTLGYTQVAPNQIYVNNPSIGTTLNINWFEEPADFLIDDEVYIPSDLIEAMQHYVAYKVFNVYKGQEEELKVRVHLDMYKMIVDEFKERTQENMIDTIYGTDLISQKGLI